MKNSLRKVSIALAALVLSTSVFAAKIAVVTEEFAPYNYTNGGKITGFSTEVVEATLKKAGIDYEIKSQPWARTYQAAQENADTLIFSIGRNEQREKLFKWVDVIAPFDVTIFKLKSRADLKAGSMDDLKKYKVAGVRDDFRTQFFMKQGFAEGKNLEVVPNNESAIRMLEAQRVDFYASDELAFFHQAKGEKIDPSIFEKGIKINELSSGLYMAFSLKTSDEIVNKAKKALAEIKKDGTFDKIKAKYLK